MANAETIQLNSDLAAAGTGTGVLALTDGHVYVIDDEILVPSNVRIFGRGATLQMANPGFPAKPLLRNKNSSDSNIQVQDMTFDGNNNDTGNPQTRFSGNGLCKFSNVTGVRLENCVFKNLGYSGAFLVRCTQVSVEGCEFFGLGSRSTTATDAERGPSLYIASSGTPVQDSEEVLVANNYFHDNYWCVHFSFRNGTVVGNRLIDNQESGLYFPYVYDTTPNEVAVAENITVTGNIIQGVKKALISASGIECHLQKSSIVGNTIRDVNSHGIAITRGHDVVIAGNTIIDVGVTIEGVAGNANATGIAIFSGYPRTPAPTTDTTGVVVRDNRIYNSGNTMKYGIGAFGVGADPGQTAVTGIASYCSLQGNDVAGSQWASGGKHYYLPGSAWDADSCISVQGLVPWSGTATLTAGVTGALSITGCPFRPNAVVLSASQDSTTRVLQSLANITKNPPGTAGYIVNGNNVAMDGGFKCQQHTKAINLVTSAGANQYVSSFGQFLEDGFSISTTTAAAGVTCQLQFTCFP